VVAGFRIEGRRALVAGGVLLLAFLPWTLVFQVYDQLYSTYYQFGLDNSSLDFASIIQLNPVMVIGLGLLVAPLYAVLHATRLRVPALFVAGLGLFLLGLGAIPLMFPQVYVLPPVLVFALLVLAAGEVLAGPLLLSTIVGPWSWRLSTAAAACWLVLTRGSIMALGALGDGRAGDDLTMASVWLGVLLCMLVGLAFAIAAWPLRNVLSSREPDQSSR
jgi:dipeptide/tripeptide permease